MFRDNTMSAQMVADKKANGEGGEKFPRLYDMVIDKYLPS